MRDRLKIFLRDENGAISVDWLILTGVIAVLVMLVVPPLLNSAGKLSDKVADYIAALDFVF